MEEGSAAMEEGPATEEEGSAAMEERPATKEEGSVMREGPATMDEVRAIREAGEITLTGEDTRGATYKDTAGTGDDNAVGTDTHTGVRSGR